MRRRCAAALTALLLTGCAARTVVHQNELPNAATAPRSAPVAPFYDEQLAWYGSVGLMDGPTLLYCVYLFLLQTTSFHGFFTRYLLRGE